MSNPTPVHPGRLPLKCLLLVLAALAGEAAFAAGTAADAPLIAPAPDWIVRPDWTAPEKFQENPNGEDFLLLDEQTRVASAETYRHNVYQIVTDSGRQASSQVYFYYDPSYQTLTLHHLRLIRGAETFDRLDPAKIQIIQQERDLDRQLYDGQRSALLILDDVRVGDILDLAYTLRGTNPVFEGKYINTLSLEWGVPVRQLHYRLLVPAGRPLLSKSIGPSVTKPRVQLLAGNEQEFTWRRTGIPIVESEDRTPSSHVVFSFLDLTEFTSWKDVVDWARPLYALDRQPQPLLDAAVASIRARGQTAEQQAVAALAFVQQEIRYLGIEMGPGSHRPSAPEEVLRRRFGDCKDKALLLTALLQRLGHTACPALVHSSNREAVLHRVPSPYAFDHVIVALDLEGRRFLLDPTLSYQRGDRLALRDIGRYGPTLRIAADSSTLENYPGGPHDTSHIVVREVFDLKAIKEAATFTITTTSTGRAADSQRSYFATRTLDQIGREYLDYYTTYYPGITLLKPVEHADNPSANTYTTTERYRIQRLFAATAGDTVLRAEFEAPSIRDYTRTPNLTQRRHPLNLNHPTHVEEFITVNLPEDWKVTPFDESVADAAFTLKAKVWNESPRKIQLVYTWESKARQIEVARLEEYGANIAKARDSLGYQLTWNTAAQSAKSPGAATPAADPFPLKWPMLGLTAMMLMAGGFVSWWLVRKANPAPPEPPVIEDATKPADPYSYQSRAAANQEGLGGWLILVAFGLFVRPAMLVSALHGGRRAYYNAAVWERLTTPGDEYYSPNFALVAPLELAVNLGLLLYSLLLLVLFFRRSHLFPRVIQVFFLCTIGAALFNLWDTSMLAAKDAKSSSEGGVMLFQALIAAAIWIPYFRVSRRVKLTFVR